MAPLKILICGGGCAGPALAYWLARGGHQVVVVERAEALRASGAQIDIRAQGIEVLRRMNLLDAVRRQRVHEDGVSFVDAHGTAHGTILANTSGKGAQALTSEYEIMRGDLVRILYEATQHTVQYVFGRSVDRFDQHDTHVVAHFSDGSSDSFDLLVGADGQGSRIRKAILPADADPYRRLGVHIAYWDVPRTPADSSIASMCHLPGSRVVLRRCHTDTQAHVYFAIRDDAPELTGLARAPVSVQKDFWSQRFRGASNHTDRFLDALPAADNFYCQEVVQVRIDRWSHGRVALLGDAAHCPSPLTGMGTTSAFVGAYVLAGEINRCPDDLPKALQTYQDVLRPFVRQVQQFDPGYVRFALPQSGWGVALLQMVMSLVCFLRLPQLAVRYAPEERAGWKLPEYEMGVEDGELRLKPSEESKL